MKKNTLPIAKIINGKVELSDPYDYDNRITCELYGVMADGTMVWQAIDGVQYYKQKFYGKYYFVRF